jgi:hypothetical protein
MYQLPDSGLELCVPGQVPELIAQLGGAPAAMIGEVPEAVATPVVGKKRLRFLLS